MTNDYAKSPEVAKNSSPWTDTNWKRFSMKKHAVLIGPAAVLCTNCSIDLDPVPHFFLVMAN